MSAGVLPNIPEVIRTYNISRSISTTTAQIYSTSIIHLTAISNTKNPNIFSAECLGFAVLILTTIIGNTLVLSALFLDKRLHSPSFFLIANMAIADLLLGISVLPFSSALELLNNRWIFGASFCTAWLALDVLCCTASIIALMAVSIDRYIGVTRPLNYSSIMTIRRTIYLIIIVWAVSILTSVVPLFGLTDRRNNSSDENKETCKVNKDTFYTIFSSLISFYIPVIILLILYSRVYQEAKKQGEKLENEKRRLYQIDYQIASEQVRQQQQQQQNNQSNGHATTRSSSHQSFENQNEASTKLLRQESILDEESGVDHPLKAIESVQLKNDYSHSKSNPDDDISHSGSSITHHKKRKHRFIGKQLFTTIKRNSLLNIPQATHHNKVIPLNDELLIIKRKLHNLKREKKAFRTVGLILGCLLICWLPFFVTLPVMSLLKHHLLITDETTENTWFKITFWLGYCNSALNPFVYAFSNRAIRRAFREVICRRCCCCLCPKMTNQSNEHQLRRRTRANSGSLTTDISLITSKGRNSSPVDTDRILPKIENDLHSLSNLPVQAPKTINGPVVSFADFLAATGDDDISLDDDDKQLVKKSIPQSPKENLTTISDSSID